MVSKMPIIQPGESMPNKKDLVKFEECFAKILLEKVYPERYKNLILSDKPDLISEDNSYGIEVTFAIPSERQEKISLWWELHLKGVKKEDQKLKRLNSLGIDYDKNCIGLAYNGYPVNDFDSSPYTNIVNSISTKVKKLNKGHYKKLDRYDLFIECDLSVLSYFLPILLDRIKQINTLGNKFSYIYVLFANDICEFNMETNSFEVRKLFFEIYDISIKAKEVLEGLKDDETGTVN